MDAATERQMRWRQRGERQRGEAGTHTGRVRVVTSRESAHHQLGLVITGKPVLVLRPHAVNHMHILREVVGAHVLMLREVGGAHVLMLRES